MYVPNLFFFQNNIFKVIFIKKNFKINKIDYNNLNLLSKMVTLWNKLIEVSGRELPTHLRSLSVLITSFREYILTILFIF